MISTFFSRLGGVLLLVGASMCVSYAQEKRPPNIIYILADDLGYADIGAFGQTKIETPNLDALARRGMRFTDHYASAPVCAPARCMLMTGKHSGHAYIRGNDEWDDRGKVWDYLAVEKDPTLEGQIPMPAETITLPKLLQQRGYKTALIGKWGLGAPHTASIPNRMGFDYFFGYNCQRQAHTYYPLHLYENQHRFPLNNDTLAPHTPLEKGADPYLPESYKRYTLNVYSPEIMFERLTQFVATSSHQPFFLYWANTIPHAPLQAPQPWVDYYVKKFGDEAPYTGKNGYFPCRYPHATYAAMISYFDEQLGKLIAQLKKQGIYEHTLIMFTSDNGPTYNGGVDAQWFESAKPFQSTQGRGKGFVYEGGIRVPMIAAWENHIPHGTTSALPSAQYDVLATVCDLVGIHVPYPTDGISFLPTLLAKGTQQRHSFLYWEFPENGGQIALRMGKWKLIRQHLSHPKKAPTLELYDLDRDPEERQNLADKKHQVLIQKMATIVDAQHQSPEWKAFEIPLLDSGVLHRATFLPSP